MVAPECVGVSAIARFCLPIQSDIMCCIGRTAAEVGCSGSHVCGCLCDVPDRHPLHGWKRSITLRASLLDFCVPFSISIRLRIAGLGCPQRLCMRIISRVIVEMLVDGTSTWPLKIGIPPDNACHCGSESQNGSDDIALIEESGKVG